MNKWMFICNPADWKIEDFLKAGHVYGTWKTNNHQPKVNDQGIIKVSGEKKGIYALVRVNSDVKFRSEINRDLRKIVDSYWATPTYTDDLLVEIEYVKVLYPNPIKVAALGAGLDNKLTKTPYASCTPLQEITFFTIENYIANNY